MGMTVYLRICEDRIWVEEDLTEEGIANSLVREGNAKSDIVLAFQDPPVAAVYGVCCYGLGDRPPPSRHRLRQPRIFSRLPR